MTSWSSLALKPADLRAEEIECQNDQVRVFNKLGNIERVLEKKSLKASVLGKNGALW